ncbi:MAG: H-X9-DG-CTERM domain-containing protein, partial [Armatimonadota bacterium]
PQIVYPSIHGRHNGFANVAWLDGHVKAMKPTPRTSGTFSGFGPADWKKNNLGDLIHPQFPFGSAGQNYYFLQVKPKAP